MNRKFSLESNNLDLQLHYDVACSRVVPGSTQDCTTPVANGIERINDYILIRFVIRFERKFAIRRSLIFLFCVLLYDIIKIVTRSTKRSSVEYKVDYLMVNPSIIL